MNIYTLDHLGIAQAQAARPYLEFLRVPALSAGIYHLPAGGVDPQQPHTEDEIYYVAQGRARITVGDEDASIMAGSIIFVAANVGHRFHSIEEDFTVLVFFAPAEYTGAGT